MAVGRKHHGERRLGPDGTVERGAAEVSGHRFEGDVLDGVAVEAAACARDDVEGRASRPGSQSGALLHALTDMTRVLLPRAPVRGVLERVSQDGPTLLRLRENHRGPCRLGETGASRAESSQRNWRRMHFRPSSRPGSGGLVGACREATPRSGSSRLLTKAPRFICQYGRGKRCGAGWSDI
jgi:hypothetical protein